MSLNLGDKNKVIKSTIETEEDIKIGSNNKIKKSYIGRKNKEKNYKVIFLGVVSSLIATLIALVIKILFE